MSKKPINVTPSLAGVTSVARRDGTPWHEEPDYATEEEQRYFGRPEAKADWSYWLAWDSLDLDQITGLSLGWEPRSLSWEHDIVGRTGGVWPLASEYEQRRDLIQNVLGGSLAEPVSVRSLLDWMRTKPDTMSPPAGMIAALAPPATSGAAGRPSSKHLYEAELERRFADGTRAEKISQQARDLVAWLQAKHPTSPRPGVKAMEDAIRARFNELKAKAAQTSAPPQSSPKTARK